MNKTIYGSSLKKSTTFLSIIIICVIATIVSLIVLFPSISSGGSYADLLRSLPQGMLSAIGMNGNVGNFNDYLNMNFYNSIYLYILMTYVIVFTAKLIAKPIEDTSLVYYLNSPVSRKEFIYSQVLVFITGLIAICVTSIIVSVIFKEIFVGNTAFNISEFVKGNLAIGCIFLFLGSLSILISAMARTNSEAITYSSTIIIAEYIFDMLVKVSGSVNWMKYITVFTFYNTKKIAEDATYFYVGCGALIAASIVLIVASAEFFKKRDLYL